MKLNRLILIVLAAAPVAALTAATWAPPAAAANVVHSALAKARDTHRNVLLIYGASWCGWCHKLDRTLDSPQISHVVDKAFVITHIDVEEHGKNQLENPGGEDQMKAYGGGGGSVPFFVVLNPDGDVLGTSNKPGTGNIGYPGEPGEIDYFMTLLHKTSPMLGDADRAKVETFLRAGGAK